MFSQYGGSRCCRKCCIFKTAYHFAKGHFHNRKWPPAHLCHIVCSLGLTPDHVFSCFLQVHTTTVGIPTGVTEFRLESVPEMNYDALGEKPVGEICIRGKSVFMGYYKNDALTDGVLTEGGWLRTGAECSHIMCLKMLCIGVQT